MTKWPKQQQITLITILNKKIMTMMTDKISHFCCIVLQKRKCCFRCSLGKGIQYSDHQLGNWNCEIQSGMYGCIYLHIFRKVLLWLYLWLPFMSFFAVTDRPHMLVITRPLEGSHPAYWYCIWVRIWHFCTYVICSFL